ncbi:hypothetical protein PNA2_0410 [Pyrococcus sp. NA2]|uniref:hypothetical protein n=1 Tax=Pyrococcus sp. (strain NA2) TaxID=342949 RepID=UPI000209A9CE|nr:hypothetical protein [Pyrococcus sp. NA2]AEC51326.1 hypothetical protein PNA2_0410 [Pyrococcus sp. NA2]
MILEKVIRPRYKIMVMKKANVEDLKKGGLQVVELMDNSELAIEYFVDSTFGKFIYIIKTEDGRIFLARGDKELKNPEKTFLVKDENGLKKSLISQVNGKERIKFRGISLGIAVVLGFLLSILTNKEDYVFVFIFIMSMLESFLERIVMFYFLGYCEAL